MSDRVTYSFLQFTHHFAPVIFSFVPTAVWRRYRTYIAAKRIRRLLEKAGPEKQELIRKATRGNEQLLKDMGIDLDDILKKDG